MPRLPASTRLADIAAAGATCFGRLGYRRTKMSEVAEQAGTSTGLVYSYVVSKEALFHLALMHGFDEPLPEELPFEAPPLEESIALIDRGLRRYGAAPKLKEAVDARPPRDVRAELASVVAEQYDNVARLRRVLRLIETCARDLPELDELYFGRRRRGQNDLLIRYVQRRSSEGRFAPMPDPAVAAQIVTEAIAWFAWKRHESRDIGRFDDDLARATVIQFACNALTGVPA